MIRCLRSFYAGVVLVGILVIPGTMDAKPPDLPEDGSFELLPMPREEGNVTCPYLRRQMIDSRAGQISDPNAGRDVLDNLERLRQADYLLEFAKELGSSGFLTEAMECCARAAELCPGSPCAERAEKTMLALALGIFLPARGSEEAAEPPTCPYCPNFGKPIREIVPEKARP